MKSFAVDLDALRSVAAAVLDANGVLLAANAGFLRLLPAGVPQPVGARVARYFIQPGFATLLAMDSDDAAGYCGLMTLGDPDGTSRSLRGQVWRSADGIRVLAEYDIDELERLTDAMLELNREATVAQQAVTRANVLLKQRETQIVETSLTDALTGVGNRRRLEQALAAEISRVRRGGGPLAAIMTDVDHFKHVNDEYGHGGGDTVLMRIGALLRAQTRPTDIVARFGGEEFVVLMPHTALAQAATKAEQIRVALGADVIDPLTRAVTASFGVAELGPEEDGASLLARADAALYQAKNGGRNRVVVSSAASSSGRRI